jgi:hypothetical protein
LVCWAYDFYVLSFSFLLTALVKVFLGRDYRRFALIVHQKLKALWISLSFLSFVKVL